MFNDRSFGYLLTMMSGILWGLSTPFMKQHSGHLAWNVRSSQNILSNVWPIIKMLSSNWKVGIYLFDNNVVFFSKSIHRIFLIIW